MARDLQGVLEEANQMVPRFLRLFLEASRRNGGKPQRSNRGRFNGGGGGRGGGDRHYGGGGGGGFGGGGPNRR